MTAWPTARWLAIGLLAVACSVPRDQAAELRQADRDFATATAARGTDGWVDYFMPDGVMFPPSGKVEGQEAIREAMSGAFPTGSRLDWEPVSALAAASGDLGYTIGRWTSVVESSNGRDSVTATGNYVTIWRRDRDGRWRVAVDIGNRDR